MKKTYQKPYRKGPDGKPSKTVHPTKHALAIRALAIRALVKKAVKR